MRLRQTTRLPEAIRSLEDLVREFDTDLSNYRNPGSHERYLELVHRSERVLRNLFADDDLASALHSKRYWHIHRYWEGRPTAYIGPFDENKWARADSESEYLIEGELRRQLERLQTVLKHLELFTPLAGQFRWSFILDTNVFLQFDPFREELDHAKWCEIVEVPYSDQLRLVVPVVVLDELDEKAHARDRKLSDRARAAQRHLDPFVDHMLTGNPKAIRPRASWMTVDILPDPPGHQRQADNDTELLDRAEFLSQVTGKYVKVVTSDRGMRVREKVRELLSPASLVRIVAMPEELRVPFPDGQEYRDGSASCRWRRSSAEPMNDPEKLTDTRSTTSVTDA